MLGLLLIALVTVTPFLLASTEQTSGVTATYSGIVFVADPVGNYSLVPGANKGGGFAAMTTSETIKYSEQLTEAFALPSIPSAFSPAARERKGVFSLERCAVSALVLIVALGFALRVRGLDRAGFNEDEIQKVDAARAYLRGDFSRNLEHPMLLKSMIAVSLAAAGVGTATPALPSSLRRIRRPPAKCNLRGDYGRRDLRSGQ